MLGLAAVEYPLVLGGGVVFVGYETALVPVDVAEGVAQFHLLTSDHGQLNPYAMEIGSRAIIKDIEQFRKMRCFLGWCEFVQINLGTRALTASVNYSGGREKEKSIKLVGFSVLSQLGASAPLSALLGLQANFKYTGHRLQFTPYGGYSKLFRDTALDLAL